MTKNIKESPEEWRGQRQGGMTPEERDEFLDQPLNVYLACITEDGAPYAVVAWYEWSDGYLWIVPRQRSRWAEYLKNEPRVSFVIDHEDRKVRGEGIAELVEEPNVGGQWVEVATRMSTRYLGENGPKYLVPTLNQPRWLFRIKPTKIESWQGTSWARRYWVEDSGGPSFDEAHGLTEA